MAVDIFLGEPPANIKQWIIDHCTPPGPVPHADTRFTLDNGTVETYDITGSSFDDSWLEEHGFWDTIEWLKPIVSVDFGTDVTGIGGTVFFNCTSLKSVTIPSTVVNIGMNAFEGCTNLESVTFVGRTMEQVQNITDWGGDPTYPWSITNTSIINVA